MTLEAIAETKLTTPERCRFAELEESIDGRIQAFYDVGSALGEIRNSRLYRDNFESFETYCQNRWGFARQYAYRLIAAHKTLENVGATEEQKAGLRETHIRPLTGLLPDAQKEVFDQAIKTAPGGQLTEKHVRATVNAGSPAETAHNVRMKAARGPVEWYTPEHIVDAAADVFGSGSGDCPGIDLDPASCEEANKIVMADKFYTLADNGLEQPWSGNVWLNPPYDKVGPWVEKMIAEYEAGNIKSAIMLVNANCETVWFSKLWKYSICFVRGRLKFWNPEKSSAVGAPHGNAVIYLGMESLRFAEVFKAIGTVFAAGSRISVNRIMFEYSPGDQP